MCFERKKISCFLSSFFSDMDVFETLMGTTSTSYFFPLSLRLSLKGSSLKGEGPLSEYVKISLSKLKWGQCKQSSLWKSSLWKVERGGGGGKNTSSCCGNFSITTTKILCKDLFSSPPLLSKGGERGSVYAYEMRLISETPPPTTTPPPPTPREKIINNSWSDLNQP